MISACSSLFPYKGGSEPNITVDPYLTIYPNNKFEVSIDSNLSKALERLRVKLLPKLRGKNIVLYVSGYENYIDGQVSALPLGGTGGRRNRVPSHNAFSVFVGSGVNVLNGGCPENSAKNFINLQISTSLVAYDERLKFIRTGWELSGDTSSSSGVFDENSWLTEDQLSLLVQVTDCSNKVLLISKYYPLILTHGNQADSFLFFNKMFGVYHTNSRATSAPLQLNRDKASLISMMNVAALLARLDYSEFALALYGVDVEYNLNTGILNSTVVDKVFDPSMAHFLVKTEYFGSSKVEVVQIPFATSIKLKLTDSHLPPTIESGVKGLRIELVYKNKTVFQRSLIGE